MFSSDEENDFEIVEQLMMSDLTESTKLVGSPTIKPTSSHVINSKISSPTRHYDGFDSESDSNNEITLFNSPARANKTMMGTSTRNSTIYVWLLSFFAAIGGFLFGYDTGVISGAMLLLKDEFDLTSLWQEVIVSVTIGAAFISALLGGFLNDKFGRKIVTILASFVFTAGAVVLAFSYNVTMLVSGRVIIGIGIGMCK